MGTMDIGMIGMGVMGSNLALNMADHGFQVAAYNWTSDLTEHVLKEHPHKNLHGFFSLKEFLDSLKRPRRIMLMIAAGSPVDSVLSELVPLLESGDIVIDGGNSFFKDTQRRSRDFEEKGIHYFGVGVSGGESGARKGPSLMPGGNKEAYEAVRPVFEAIAAKAGDDPCCAYIGTDGAGHYVKMVHNGIEYADMQLIAESYLLLKYIGGFSSEKLSETYAQWNEGELKSFLIGITSTILRTKDEDGRPLVDKILDSAGQKGTGRWTSIAALEQGVNVSMITAACNARAMSNLMEERMKAKRSFQTSMEDTALPDNFVEMVRESLYVAKIMAYAQGFSLYRSASSTYGWCLDYGRIASIFRAGCIIQADFLGKITEAYQKNPDLPNLMEDTYFRGNIAKYAKSLRRILSLAMLRGIPVPAMANALSYLDSFCCEEIGASLIQAQRDYFGAHTFRRKDKDGIFHHIWQK